ncbi:Ti-type conjugative transfer relaxase TraA [Agrobacterium tumefaciens]|uniref:Ti-type conjugative transfer relaxase TraA n=1 Tax=Agrobacterium tumefaciens TaxID=358 RepID=UPI0022437460|nr:Ti-type conjugative transfer relaxase TraA [Agrobacterium tumefaciens]MCW8060162.1 Ti-type conjugative transfer relaxase TraA [Agrobacterium tumefaciens]
MAITHFTPQIISRGEGRSAVAAAAYRHTARMENQREGRVADFSHKPGLVHSEFALPADAPNWAGAMIEGKSPAQSSEAFWNKVEAFEARKDAQLAKEFILALPVELSTEQNIALMRDFISSEVTSRGFVADWVYHDAPGNPHVHLMTNLRPLTDDGFGAKKAPVLDEDGQPQRSKSGQIQYRLWAGDKADFLSSRDAWYDVQNKHLQMNGHDLRVDGRSYSERGIELVPTPHIGVPTKNIKREADAQSRTVDLERLALHHAARRENARRIDERPEIVLDAISWEKSVFDERDIAKYLHRYIGDAGQFANLMARILQSPEIAMVEAEGVDFATGEVLPNRYATRDMIRIEAEMAEQADRLSVLSGFGVSRSTRAEVLAANGKLSNEQRVAIERITGDERLALVVGRAGAGKTTMMKAAREIWEANGYKVVGAALAGKAAEGLQKEAGIASRTLASWQLQWQKGQAALDDKTVFVIDEAGMVASRQMAEFVSAVDKAGAKIVLVGDADQLQPIEAGGAFRKLADNIGYAELGTIWRQREQWMRDASMDLARGNVADALKAYHDRGHVVEVATKDDAIASLIKDWMVDYDPARSSVILAYMRKDVRVLNERARAALQARGIIGQGAGFRTEEGTRNFAVGDQVVFLKNEKSLGLMNGMIGRVVESEMGKITVDLGGDGPGAERPRRVEIDQAFYRNVDHGYATTIHKSQGATVDRVKVLASSMFDRHLSYVALTRHRDSVELYASAQEFARYSRVDHAAGVTGKLIDAGMAKFRDVDDVKPTPYADLLDAAGTTHRLWGVSLPDAMEKAGVAIGDVVRLRKDGTEEVLIKVPVVDEVTGAQTWEERVGERNVWTATLIGDREPAAQTLAAAYLYSKGGRVDHAAGINGELLEVGKAQFGEDEKGRETPYANVLAVDGAVHRLWGVSLPNAIDRSRAAIGDTISLRRDGVEDVNVPVKKVDPTTGKTTTTWESARRNVWTVDVIETAAAREARVDAAQQQPEQSRLLAQLVTRMSRSGAKTTTLDYAGSRRYDQALAYATNRGIYGLRMAKALAMDHARWIKAQRDRIASAGARLSKLIGRFGQHATMGRTVSRQAAGSVALSQPWLRGVATWANSISQAVEVKVQGDATLTVHWTKINERMNFIYEKPDAAMKAMNLAPALNGDDATAKAAQDRIINQLASNPEAYGAIKGKTGLLASGAAKAQRQNALGHVDPLAKSIRDYIRIRAEVQALHTGTLQQERDRQRVDVPSVSDDASCTLERIRDAIDRNDLHSQLGFALSDRIVRAEIEGLNKVLDEKFGANTFSSAEPKGKKFDAAAAKVTPEDQGKLAQSWPLFNAAQKVAAHEKELARAQTKAQNRDQGMTR